MLSQCPRVYRSVRMAEYFGSALHGPGLTHVEGESAARQLFCDFDAAPVIGSGLQHMRSEVSKEAAPSA
jgi:hypothetical protein